MYYMNFWKARSLVDACLSGKCFECPICDHKRGNGFCDKQFSSAVNSLRYHRFKENDKE